MDYIITLAVLGFFACLLYRKHRKKKNATPPDRGAVRTSELPSVPDKALATPVLYPAGSQVETYAFDLRKYTDTLMLSSDMEMKINRYLIDCQLQERDAFVQYIPVGTTLIMQFIRTL